MQMKINKSGESKENKANKVDEKMCWQVEQGG